MELVTLLFSFSPEKFFSLLTSEFLPEKAA